MIPPIKMLDYDTTLYSRAGIATISSSWPCLPTLQNSSVLTSNHVRESTQRAPWFLQSSRFVIFLVCPCEFVMTYCLPCYEPQVERGLRLYRTGTQKAGNSPALWFSEDNWGDTTMQNADATFKRVPRASKYLPVIESFTREKWVKILSGARGFCEEAKTSKSR